MRDDSRHEQEWPPNDTECEAASSQLAENKPGLKITPATDKTPSIGKNRTGCGAIPIGVSEAGTPYGSYSRRRVSNAAFVSIC